MGGKSKAQTIGYHYKWAMHLAWCRAADALLEIRAGGATAWQGRVTANTTLAINKPELWGGEKSQGGIVSDLEVLFGGETQAPSTYLADTFGAKQSGNRGIVSTILKGGRYGAFVPNPKPMSAKFERIHADGLGWYPEKAAITAGTQFSYDQSGWSYKVEPPGSSADYSAADFDHSGWAVGPGGFGSTSVGGLALGTYIAAGELGKGIWLRRVISALPARAIVIDVYHDDGATLWWNGVQLSLTPVLQFHSTVTVPASLVASSNTVALRVLDGIPTGSPTHIFAGLALAQQGSVFSGMNGAHMIYEALCHQEMTDEPEGLINSASFIAAADQLYSEGLGLCTRYDSSQETPWQFIQRICDAIGATCTQSRVDGLYYLDLIRGGYDLEALPVITDADILEFKQAPVVPNEAINAVRVKWTDPATGDERTTSPVVALGRVQDAGETIVETRNYLEIPTEALALRLAQRDVDAASPTLSRYTLTVKRKHRSLRPGQPFRLQLLAEGIADAVLRLGSIRHGTHLDGRVRIEAVQDVFHMPESAAVAPSPSEWVAPSKVPAAPPAQVVLEAPYVELVAAMSTADLNALAADAGFLLTAAARPTVGLNYAIASAAGAEDYVERGTADFCPTALIVEAAPLEDPLPTEFTLADGSLLDRVELGSWALWDDEIVRVDAIDSAAGTCTLGRGCADTPPAPHAAGARIWFCGDWVGSDGREYVDAEVVKAKLLTRTTSGQLALGDGVESQVTMAQRWSLPYAPGALKFSDATLTAAVYPAELAGTITASWQHRDRMLQADQLVDATSASVGPEDGTTYTVRYEQPPGTEVHSETAISGLAATPYAFPADGLARITVEAVRDGLVSWRAAGHTFAYFTAPNDTRVTVAGDTRITVGGDTRVSRG